MTNLNLDFRKYSPEEVTFLPTKLEKNPGKIHVNLFRNSSFHDSHIITDYVVTLRAYEEGTKENQNEPNSSQLFIGLIKPYKPVTPSTIARWLKSILSSSGVDTNIAKAHSVRGATTTAAANAGVTTNDIHVLKAADWSSESVFQRLYYKPDNQNSFGIYVLSQLSTTKEQ